MNSTPPFILSIAGHDPSGGAGIIADTKTITALGGYALTAITALTVQNENTFNAVYWTDNEVLTEQINITIEKYRPAAIKIGLVKNPAQLDCILSALKAKNINCPIIFDPVLSATAGFDFYSGEDDFLPLLNHISLITPNYHEAQILTNELSPQIAASHLLQYTNVLLKGGHSEDNLATDSLYTMAGVQHFSNQKSTYSKHGTGCILSSAIATYMAFGKDMASACEAAKAYTLSKINSHSGLLAF